MRRIKDRKKGVGSFFQNLFFPGIGKKKMMQTGNTHPRFIALAEHQLTQYTPPELPQDLLTVELVRDNECREAFEQERVNSFVHTNRLKRDHQRQVLQQDPVYRMGRCSFQYVKANRKKGIEAGDMCILLCEKNGFCELHRAYAPRRRVQPDVQPDVPSDVHPDVQPDVRPVRPDVRPDVRSDVHPDVQPGVHPDVRSDVHPDVRPVCPVRPVRPVHPNDNFVDDEDDEDDEVDEEFPEDEEVPDDSFVDDEDDEDEEVTDLSMEDLMLID